MIAPRLSKVPTKTQKKAPSLPSTLLAGPKAKPRRPGIFSTSGMCTSRKCLSNRAGSAGLGYITISLLLTGRLGWLRVSAAQGRVPRRTANPAHP